MKQQYITSFLITSLIYYAAYWNVNVGLLVRLTDALFLIISFTLPLMLIARWEDVVRYRYLVPALFLAGLLIFSVLAPRTDPQYDSSRDGLIVVFPSALVFLILSISAQILLNLSIHWMRDNVRL